MSKTVGYVRVSTEEQKKFGDSIQVQEERIRAYCSLHELTLVNVFVEDGVSGSIPIEQRPQGRDLIELVHTRKYRIENLVAVRLDRLFRNVRNALEQSAALDKRCCALHVIDLGGTTLNTRSAIGRMFFTILAALAEMEGALTGERTANRQGKYLYPNDKELEVVGFIQKCREDGFGYGTIASFLNKSNTPTKLGGRWHPITVSKLLRIHTELGKELPGIVT